MKDKPTPSDIGSVQADPVPFRFLSTATGSQWIELNSPGGEDPKVLADYEATRQRFERQLTDVLLAENLVILTGLGTSMCLKGSDGQEIQAAMGLGLFDKHDDQRTKLKALEQLRHQVCHASEFAPNLTQALKIPSQVRDAHSVTFWLQEQIAKQSS